MRNVLVFSLLLCALLAFSQKKEKPVKDYIPTENIEGRKEGNIPSNRPKRKNIALIYVPFDSKKIMYGNPCATAETHRMGFEYIVEPTNGRESKSTVGKILNNLWVKTKLVITRSPFWKVILNSRIKKCRQQTGDFVG